MKRNLNSVISAAVVAAVLALGGLGAAGQAVASNDHGEYSKGERYARSERHYDRNEYRDDDHRGYRDDDHHEGEGYHERHDYRGGKSPDDTGQKPSDKR